MCALGSGGLPGKSLLAAGGRRNPKKSVGEWLPRLEHFYGSEPAESLPEQAYFNDIEASWQVFVLMECYRDEYGNWRGMSAKELLDQPDWLQEDLLTWKRLAGIIERRIEAKRKANKDGT